MSANSTNKKRNATSVAQTEASIHDQQSVKQLSPSVDQSEDFIHEESAVKQSSPVDHLSEDFIHDQSTAKQSSTSDHQTDVFIHEESAVKQSSPADHLSEDFIHDQSTAKQSSPSDHQTVSEQETSQSQPKQTDQNDDINDETFSGFSNMTENLDGCFIFTLIGNRYNWRIRVLNLRTGETKNILDIPIGMMDGTLSQLTVWGDGGQDIALNYVATYFRYSTLTLSIISYNI